MSSRRPPGGSTYQAGPKPYRTSAGVQTTQTAAIRGAPLCPLHPVSYQSPQERFEEMFMAGTSNGSGIIPPTPPVQTGLNAGRLYNFQLPCTTASTNLSIRPPPAPPIVPSLLTQTQRNPLSPIVHNPRVQQPTMTAPPHQLLATAAPVPMLDHTVPLGVNAGGSIITTSVDPVGPLLPPALYHHDASNIVPLVTSSLHIHHQSLFPPLPSTPPASICTMTRSPLMSHTRFPYYQQSPVQSVASSGPPIRIAVPSRVQLNPRRMTTQPSYVHVHPLQEGTTQQFHNPVGAVVRRPLPSSIPDYTPLTLPSQQHSEYTNPTLVPPSPQPHPGVSNLHQRFMPIMSSGGFHQQFPPPQHFLQGTIAAPPRPCLCNPLTVPQLQFPSPSMQDVINHQRFARQYTEQDHGNRYESSAAEPIIISEDEGTSSPAPRQQPPTPIMPVSGVGELFTFNYINDLPSLSAESTQQLAQSTSLMMNQPALINPLLNTAGGAQPSSLTPASSVTDIKAESDSSHGQLPEKPPYSISALIGIAISSLPNKQATIKDIYSFISDIFPYYSRSKRAWKNSVRNCLQMSKCFKQATTSLEPGPVYWAINEESGESFMKGSFQKPLPKKRKRTYTVRKKATGSYFDENLVPTSLDSIWLMYAEEMGLKIIPNSTVKIFELVPPHSPVAKQSFDVFV